MSKLKNNILKELNNSTDNNLHINDITIVYDLINNTNIVNELEILMSEIFEDGKVDYHDVPNIILFISKILINYKISYNNFNNIYNIIKFITEVIMFTYMHKELSEEEYNIINKIIKYSLELLQFNSKLFDINCNCLNFSCLKRFKSK